MHRCPHCGEPSVTTAQKLSIPPGKTIPCPKCSGPVGLSSAVVTAYVPIVIGGLIYFQWGSGWSRLAILLGVLAASFLLWRRVPLWRPGVDVILRISKPPGEDWTPPGVTADTRRNDI